MLCSVGGWAYCAAVQADTILMIVVFVVVVIVAHVLPG